MSTTKRKKYNDEFRAEAVKLVVEKGYSLAEASRNLGINANMLGRWKKQLTATEADAKTTDANNTELRRLREEVRRLKMERDILKKATVGMPHHFFASESNCGIDSLSSK